MATTYIFYVHSNVTIYLSKHYIDLNGIENSNIIVLYDRLNSLNVGILPGRKFHFSENFKIIHLNRRNFWPSFRAIKNFINKEVKKEYFFFVPHVYTESLQLFASNKKCKKVVFIEEGDMSYFSEDVLNSRFCDKSLRSNLYRKIFSLGILYKKHPFPKIKKAKEAICLHEDAFPFHGLEKHIYSFKDVFFEKEFSSKEYFDNSVVFLLDAFYPKEINEKEEYYAALRRAFLYLKENLGSTIYFKPHPVISNNKKQIDLILNIAFECGLQGSLTYTAIELIIANYANVKVVTHFSSLIRYCFYADIKPYFWGKELIKNEDQERPKPMHKFLSDNSRKVMFIGNN